MNKDKTLFNQVASASYDPADRPFDFVGRGGKTALVCEPDPALREKINDRLRAKGYQITLPATARDALKAMRFHIFDVVVINELFDTTDPQNNDILQYLESTVMSIRRRFLVALVSDRYRTKDNMAAFNRSVNIIINRNSIDDIGEIIEQGVADHRAFYLVFQETLRKMGKV
jgi:DNA-binding NtrC family response regulator